MISQKLQCGYYGLGDCQPLYIGRALAKDPRSFHQSVHLDIISHLVWFDFLFNPMYTDYLFFHLKALCSWKHKCLHRWNSKLKGSIPQSSLIFKSFVGKIFVSHPFAFLGKTNVRQVYCALWRRELQLLILPGEDPKRNLIKSFYQTQTFWGICLSRS